MSQTLTVLTAYSDDTGDHAAGSQVTFPDDTPDEQLAIQTLIDTGILTNAKESQT